MILSLLAGPARAEICDKMRPNWDGTPVTAIGEAVILFSSPVCLALLVATAFAIRFRSVWGGLAVTVCWTIVVTFVVQSNPDKVRKPGLEEGCMGEPTLFIALAIAISVATILLTARGKRGNN